MALHGAFARSCMMTAGQKLAEIFVQIEGIIQPGMSTLELDAWIDRSMARVGLIAECKKVSGYRHASCISRNDEIVHGVPRAQSILQTGDVLKVDVVASYKGFCADMARTYSVNEPFADNVLACLQASQRALDAGIAACIAGNRVGDISAAIETTITQAGNYGIIRDFAGHGIGKRMHENPEILNYGKAGTGPMLQEGMGLALEPMVTLGAEEVLIDADGWTARTRDGSLAIHVEDTVIIGPRGPEITTRLA
jgi:methionyl aminopeptidase